MGRILTYILVIGLLGFGGWWYSEDAKHITDRLIPRTSEEQILTIEAKWTPDELMKNRRSDFLKTKQHEFRSSSLCFFPYLLIEAKYTGSDKRTAEGHTLWSLCQGEMVLNTDNFETTHGFEDCMRAQANETDFRILNLLASHGGSMSQDDLSEDAKMNPSEVSSAINSLKKKHLVTIKGSDVRLHFQDPLIRVSPQSKINQPIVTRQIVAERLIPGKYTPSQIKKLCQAAFGQDFGIRREEKIYIPAIEVEVQNPDGTISKSFWNAVTGKRIELKQFDYLYSQ